MVPRESTAVSIRILVDDCAGPGLAAEHGFSALVRADGIELLFDAGQGPALARNAKGLGVDLTAVRSVVLSHSHYDHTGGIPKLMSGRDGPEVYYHPSILRKHWSVDRRGPRDVGVPQPALLALQQAPADHHHPVLARLNLTENVGLIAPIRRTTEFEDTGGPFFLDPDGRTPDPIEDDLVLWIKTSHGLVLVVGCCHAGIVNTVREVTSITGINRVRGVVGGLHLLNADGHRLRHTVEELGRFIGRHTEDRPGNGPPVLLPCHCTGAAATRELQHAFGSTVLPGLSGFEWRLE